jgi:ribosomal protein L11 methyltransferase
MLIGDRFRVVPTVGEPGGDDRIELVITRGAFGSGEHETTVSCLEMLEDMAAVAGAKMLDLGSGTGILAIAAIKLGAADAVCLDIDPRAVATGLRNCALNRVTDRARHVLGTLACLTTTDFDLVAANIHGDVLLAHADDLVATVKPGATLLLSGILWEDTFRVERRYRDLGCRLVRTRMLEEYTTMLFFTPRTVTEP